MGPVRDEDALGGRPKLATAWMGMGAVGGGRVRNQGAHPGSERPKASRAQLAWVAAAAAATAAALVLARVLPASTRRWRLACLRLAISVSRAGRSLAAEARWEAEPLSPKRTALAWRLFKASSAMA